MPAITLFELAYAASKITIGDDVALEIDVGAFNEPSSKVTLRLTVECYIEYHFEDQQVELHEGGKVSVMQQPEPGELTNTYHDLCFFVERPMTADDLLVLASQEEMTS